MERDNKGQFVRTTGSTKRKRVQYKHNHMHESQRIYCKLLGIEKLPRALVVHHIDGDPTNDDVNNLSLMTYTAHNRIHAKDRKIWNKGLTTDTSEKWKKTIELAIYRKTKRRFKVFEEAALLRMKGVRVKEIAKRQGICDRQVYTRIRRYHELKQKYGN